MYCGGCAWRQTIVPIERAPHLGDRVNVAKETHDLADVGSKGRGRQELEQGPEGSAKGRPNAGARHVMKACPEREHGPEDVEQDRERQSDAANHRHQLEDGSQVGASPLRGVE